MADEREKREDAVEFRPMRRRKQELPVGEAVAILRRGTSGVLALAGDGSYPYAVPMTAQPPLELSERAW